MTFILSLLAVIGIFVVGLALLAAICFLFDYWWGKVGMTLFGCLLGIALIIIVCWR